MQYDSDRIDKLEYALVKANRKIEDLQDDVLDLRSAIEQITERIEYTEETNRNREAM